MKYKLNLFLLFIISLFIVQCNPSTKNGESDVKVIENPEQPKEGVYDLIADELLTLGTQKDNSKYFFTRIRNVDSDKDGKIYVLDNASKIIVFDKQGKYLMQFGQKGNGPGDYGPNTDFAITSDNRIVLADPVNYRYCFFDLQGHYLNLSKAKGFYNNIQLDKNDNIYSSYSDYDKKNMTKKDNYITLKQITTVYKHPKDSETESIVGEFRGTEEKVTIINGGVNSEGIFNEFVWKLSPKGYILSGFAETYLFSKYSLDGKLIGKFGRKYSRITNRNVKKVVADDPYLPVFTTNSLFDADGNFWVNLDNGDKPEYYIYDIFSADGVYQKQVYSKYRINKIKGDTAISIISSDKGESLVKVFKCSFTKKK